MTHATSRAAAAEVLARVLAHGQSLTLALSQRTDGLKDPRERALARELCFGVMRYLPRLEAVVGHLMDKAPRKKDRDIFVLLLLGIYQLLYTRLPPHAAVAETVAVADARGKPWAKGLINGVLRNLQRRREAVLQAVDGEIHVRLAHPRWLVGELKDAWPGDWENILVENNQHAPMTLRVNERRMTRDAWLQDHPDLADPIPFAPGGIRLRRASEVSEVPGFAQGMLSVQDGGAQLAPDLLDLAPGQRVLDACAAPGGKSAHILERQTGIDSLTAIEQDPARLGRLEETMRRLDLPARPLLGDAGESGEWWDGRPFHRILLDVPCSGTGVIRRHPDIKFHRRPGDIAQYVQAQGRLLRALWPLLAPGGLLVYVTCSVLPRENQQQIRRFLKEQPDAGERVIDARWGRGNWGRGQDGPGRQILPGEDGMDGFYYVRLEKRPREA